MKQSKSYSEKLKDPRWQRKCLETMERDGWKCKFCGDEFSTLNVHHLEYTGDPWNAPDDKLITLCEYCHAIIGDHDLKKFGELQKVVKFVKNEKNHFWAVAFYERAGLFGRFSNDGLEEGFVIGYQDAIKFKTVSECWIDNRMRYLENLIDIKKEQNG